MWSSRFLRSFITMSIVLIIALFATSCGCPSSQEPASSTGQSVNREIQNDAGGSISLEDAGSWLDKKDLQSYYSLLCQSKDGKAINLTIRQALQLK